MRAERGVRWLADELHALAEEPQAQVVDVAPAFTATGRWPLIERLSAQSLMALAEAAGRSIQEMAQRAGVAA